MPECIPAATAGGDTGNDGQERGTYDSTIDTKNTVAMLVTIARRGAGLNGGMRGRYDWNVGVLQGDAVRLVGPALQGAPHLALAPDGSRVALVRGDAKDGLQVLDLAGGDPRTVATEGGGFPAFSPDGRTIAYSGDGTSIRFAAVP